ncbi:hypothetical protein IFM89_015098 [Coptis chinensis]|uniref:Uncharacterized protein n=1 Tax=Coptis chinensis TaxID=261450 RepID=A0A835M8Z9_9MAGN|nr:hypothetical protein IFM89_015098 [Coptis chinensis]
MAWAMCGYRTPLQVAKTPNLDPVEAGLAYGSDTAHLPLLGVQNDNELEKRESQIRRAFDAQDQSGEVGFISVWKGFMKYSETRTSICLVRNLKTFVVWGL